MEPLNCLVKQMEKFSVEMFTALGPRIPVEHDGDVALAEDKLTVKTYKTQRNVYLRRRVRRHHRGSPRTF